MSTCYEGKHRAIPPRHAGGYDDAEARIHGIHKAKHAGGLAPAEARASALIPANEPPVVVTDDMNRGPDIRALPLGRLPWDGTP